MPDRCSFACCPGFGSDYNWGEVNPVIQRFILEEFELAFPCDFSIRVIGLDERDFEAFVREVVGEHVPGIAPDSFSTRSSSGAKYISVSVAFIAESREQLDALYEQLGSDERVKVVL